MASNDEVNITSQLLTSMQQTKEYLQVLHSIGNDMKAMAEDVRLIKERQERIEARDRTIQENHMEARISSERMRTMDDRMTSVESTLTAMNGTLNNLNESHAMQAGISSYRVKTMGDRMTSIESTLTAINGTLSNVNESHAMQAGISSERMTTIEDRMTSVESTLTAINGTLTVVTESHVNVENTLKSMEETNSKMNTMLKGIPGYGSSTPFDAIYKGRNVIFSDNLRTATRKKPTEDDGRFAGVVSNSVLEDDQLFQIRIDEAIDYDIEWGIAIGVIKEKKERIKDARTIFRNIKGTWAIRSDDDTESKSNLYLKKIEKNTWAIYSSSDSQSVKSHTWKDGKRITKNGYPLPTNHLKVGTLLGVSRRSNGNLHFYLDGVDKGAAFVNVPKDVYAFVDMIAYVTKISITN